ncbi:MAG: hydrogenase expression/formation protein HypE [Rhodobacteraceae bacterium]|jgi:hydrogenase expression/formation protein HypE|nr:hydrogenase expression/formation protein HypE [Paracoccaceae bacterium]
MKDLDSLAGVVELRHGAGGRDMAELIARLFVAAFGEGGEEDQAVLALPPGRVALSTDGFVIAPLFFPGGDIGSLAVNGTVNDIAMGGAEPVALTAGFILEEGFPLADLARIVASMAQAARAAGVRIVTGDTKVVERGKGDGVFITTAGVGVVAGSLSLSVRGARPGDAVIVSGTMGDHGVAVMATRAGFDFETEVVSDCAALNGLAAALLAAAPGTRSMRDPTRGGLAAVLNEIAQASGVGIVIREAAVPVHPAVRGACELLGLDPLYVANEGKLVAVVPPEQAAAALAALRAHPLGQDAAVIGAVRADPDRFVEMETAFGGRRMVDWIAGEQLPRIC